MVAGQPNYTPLQGASQPASGAFPTGVDTTGLGVSSKEWSKIIPLVAGGGTTPSYANDFAYARGGLNGPGNAPPPLTSEQRGQTTFGAALQNLTNLDADTIQQLQQDMFQARLYSRTYYKRGAPDPATGLLDEPTLAAFIKTLRISYNQQIPYGDVLAREKANHPELAGVNSPEDMPPSYRLTNPIDIAAAAHSSAQKNLGRRASMSELAAITNGFHQQEASFQQTNDLQPGSVAVQAPGVDEYANNYFQKSNPQEYTMHNALGIADQMMQLMQQYGTTTAH